MGADAPLWVGASRLDPTDPAVGALTADSETEFNGSEVRFYLPSRENNQIEMGALINGAAYDEGTLGDPWPEQRDNEFTVHIETEDGTILLPSDHDNSMGSGPSPMVASGFSFYYDTIVMRDSPIVIPPVTPPSEPSGPGTSTPPGTQEPDYLSMYPDDWTRDDWLRKQEKEYKRLGTTRISYEGFSQYGRLGESLFSLDLPAQTIR